MRPALSLAAFVAGVLLLASPAAAAAAAKAKAKASVTKARSGAKGGKPAKAAKPRAATSSAASAKTSPPPAAREAEVRAAPSEAPAESVLASTLDAPAAPVTSPPVRNEASAPSEPAAAPPSAWTTGLGEPAGRDAAPTSTRRAAEDDAGRLRVGALVGIGFPRPLTGELLVKTGRLVIGLEGAYAPEVSVRPVSGSLRGVAADFRVMVAGPVFIGLGAGHQRVSLRGTVPIMTTDPTPITATADTLYVNPRIGVLYRHGSGITLGADVGVHVPVQSEMATTAPRGGESIERYLAQVAGVLGHKVTPSADLLRVGAMF